ncbi:bifunctional 4-hydroxy-2-oxoglutarate aldolase/2-dehydro-3-deoxy-phosphogluconate aldolase [Actinocorallia sp. A-T 12471]|uniref:bifunctional 4-hydroxy-2-oxoglutarate aldolase/2-dehydro-3-deoxy-phosphogluconate aldolase n=1 Tax=Actinocorallia sp. A-T 12471 TaxID=3089813 RepID=UPI0029D0ADF8|nr:bifunctional 4-hydroxy-2-oxoglutarate aldolase/2-dehydro-3-deoxy-phosphogluconate aldolase [Actinocorallia sp. A-T 12471]MDX6739721.1 bifunctional 4-hydroxy-2-oxoglutarate aldolase/2-dehydro-3-deoxy-phosphogluconate aldolase [Actinocorallia sp. A-T 12471]
MRAEDLMNLAPVIPVVVLEDADSAVPMARALVAGGLPVIEVTLRTEAGLESIRRIAAEVEGAVVGAGTVTGPQSVKDSVAAGAQFLVSPGCTDILRTAMAYSGVPFLPGVATASEAMKLREQGITAMKFFPATASGGAPFLKAVSGPLPDITFCPTGGVTPANAPDFLGLPNVACVGGTWLTPADALTQGDWTRIEKLAAEAAALRP